MPLGDDLEQRISTRLGDQLYLDAQRNALNDVSPAAARRDSQLRRSSGILLDSFDETSRQIAEVRERQNRAREAIRQAPALGPVLADPRRYHRVADDLDSLSRLSVSVSRMALMMAPGGRPAPAEAPVSYAQAGLRALSTFGPIGYVVGTLAESAGIDIGQRGARETALAVTRDISPRSLGRSLVAGGARIMEQIHGVNEMLAPIASPFSPILEAQQQASREGGDYWRSIAESWRSPTETRFGRDVLSGVESAPTSVVAYAGGAATGSAKLTAAALGLLTAGGSYREGRAANLSPLHATFYGLVDGTIEAGTELIPLKGFLGDLAARRGAASTIMRNVLLEGGTEQVATLGQDFNRWAQIDGPNGKPFAEFVREIPDHAVSTFISAAVVASAQSSAGVAIDRLANRSQQGEVARASGRLADRIMEAAGSSRLRQESPEDFQQILADQLQDHPGEHLFIPAEAIRTLHQSPEELADDPFWGDYVGQISEAEALGGDVVIPLADFATHIAGTPQWEALKEQVRMSPGGMSRAEADEWDTASGTAMRETGEQLAEMQEAERARMEPVQKVYEAMRDKLLVAGFTPDAASQLATQYAQRQRVRAERLGGQLMGEEAGRVEVRQVLPERLAKIQKADDLDLVIRAMKRGKEVGATGPSLLEFIVARGGIVDTGGDVRQMGGADWHKGKAFRRQLIREDLLGAENMPDALALAAWEAGYFPGLAERPTVNDLLDAIDRELRGSPVLVEERAETTDEVRMAAQDLRQLLDQQGLDETATPQQIKEAVQRYQSESAEGRVLEQSFMEGPRGRITFTTDGRSVIDLFEARDLSTMIHETGHLYLEELKADAELALQMDTDQARQLFADWEAVKAWFKREGHEIGEDGVIPTEAHELWARGFERFAMEGNAPSAVLKRAFEAFRTWLLTIYKVVENLRAPITPEIRDVMTRLLATDEEIAAAAEEQEIRALFNTAEEAGMTEAEFAVYRTATEEARGEAYDALLYRTMAVIRAARTKEFRERKERVEAEVMAEVDRQPVFQALRLLRSGRIGDEEQRKVKLDRQGLIDIYGKDALDLIPRSVPPIYADKNTVHPDLIAEETGFASGDEMIRTLMGHEAARQDLRAAGDKRSPRQVQIDEMTAARMAERYGDPLRDGSIEEEARALIHNDKQGEVIASELRSLGRRANKKPTPYAIARRWAADKIAAGKVNDVISGTALQQYQRTARKAGKAAEEAMLKGDIDETFRQKQAQMLNNALISEGKKAKDKVDTAVRRLGRIARRRTMPSVDQDYLDQAHQLLEQVDFQTRSQRNIDKQINFETWHAAQIAIGNDPVVPEGFAGRLGDTHWSRLTVEELIGLDDTVKQIMHLGRTKQTLLDGQERRDYEEGRDHLVASAGGAGKQRRISDANDPKRHLPERVKSRIRWADAAFVKVEQMVDWLDAGDSNGPWNRLVFKPLADAQGAQGDLMRVYAEKIDALVSAIPRSQARDWDRDVDTPELINKVSPDPTQRGRPFTFGKDQIVMMAANWGNEGNRQRLIDGYGWSEAQVKGVLDRLMTEEDWHFVQGVWDALEELKPALFELERRVNGFEPDAVMAEPVETPFGTFRGGYFPAVADPQYSTSAELQEQDRKLGGKGFFRASTRASSAKERAARNDRQLLLNMSVVTNHMAEVIHDITHREAVIQVRKLFADGKVRGAVSLALGPEYMNAMEGWLENIATPNIADTGTFKAVAWMGRHLHRGTSLVGLGYRISTVLVQPLGMSNLAGIIGERAVAEGMATFAAGQRVTRNVVYDEVVSRSAEMRDRFATMDASISDMFAERAKNKLQRFGPSRFEKYAFHGILYADLLITTGGWIGAFNKGLRDGMTEAEATYYADKAIRTSQGAGGEKDKSAILRQNAFIRSFYPFFSYLNALYNQQRDIGRRVRNVRSVGNAAEIARRAWWVLIVPPLLQALLFGQGPDEDDEESWAAYLTRAVAVGNFASIPGVGPIVSAWNRQWGYSATSFQRGGEGVVRVGQDVAAAFDPDDEVSGSWLKNVLTTAGVVFAKPTGQIATTGQFAYDVATGESQPETAGDYYEGITKGRVTAN